MKKIFFLFITFIFVASVHADPPTTCGALSGDETWSADVHVTCDVTVGNGITLTIDPGVTVSFDAGASLIITGSGSLIANGSSTSKITFTAYSSSWGHIAFNDPSGTGSSSLDYCIIEHGSVSGSGYAGAGGGILIRNSNVTVYNSIIRNNSSDWGGGIFIDNYNNPPIYNCLFKDNTTVHGGGGIYCWNGVSSIIENCIFDSNHCTEPSYSSYSGGAVTAQSSAPIQILNCTFANNTSTQPGDALLIYVSSGALIENCILWGSSDQIAGAITSQVVNCAIEGSSNYTNTVNLTHSGETGPNFTATDGSDWSIKVISPCLDAGTSSGAPATDYLGNSRVRNYDIGAYEVQYNYWETTAASDAWNDMGNWHGGLPSSPSDQDVVIPSGATNYPTGGTIQNFEVGSGYGLVLEPGAKVTLGTLTVSGELKLESDASNISSLIVTKLYGNAAIVELYLTGGGGSNYKWHYISTPVSSLSTDVFTAQTLNLAQYVEARPTTDLLQGWVAYDGYVYSGGWDNGNSFSNLYIGQGYNYYKSTDQIFSFSGTLNTADVVKGITFGGNATYHGFNLLGNPFSSGLNWDDIVSDKYFAFPSNTSKGLYFTRDNSQCSYISGVGYPDASVTGIIPPMQGFFIKTTNTSTTITLPAAARAHNIPARYKGSQIIPLVRIELNDNGIKDNTVVRFDQKANSGLDNDFDAIRMFLSATTTSIYSSMNGIKYAINGQPFPETFVEIPVAVNVTTSGSHSIKATQLQGLDNYNVTLTDKSNSFTVDLKTSPSLAFSSDAGTVTDRFILKVATIITGVEKPVISKNTFNIYPANNFINIQTMSDDWDGKTGSVKVLDITGKTVNNLSSAEFSKNSNIRVEAPAARGIYIVELRSGVMRYVGKVIVR